MNPEYPWKTQVEGYDARAQTRDTGRMLRKIFDGEEELSIADVAHRIIDFRQSLEEPSLGLRGNVGNIRIATARAAADAFRQYMDLQLPASEDADDSPLDVDRIRREGKPSPYGKRLMVVPDKRCGPKKTGTLHSVDYTAAIHLYKRDILALLIAREYDFEDYLHPREYEE